MFGREAINLVEGVGKKSHDQIDFFQGPLPNCYNSNFAKCEICPDVSDCLVISSCILLSPSDFSEDTGRQSFSSHSTDFQRLIYSETEVQYYCW